MDKIIKNYEEPLERPSTTKEYFKFLMHKRSANKKHKKFLKSQNKKSEHPPIVVKQNTCGHPECQDIEHLNQDNVPPTNDKIFRFAIVVEDIVVDIMNVQQGLADILSRNPVFIEVTNSSNIPKPGNMYKDEKFVDFNDVVFKTHPTLRG